MMPTNTDATSTAEAAEQKPLELKSVDTSSNRKQPDPEKSKPAVEKAVDVPADASDDDDDDAGDDDEGDDAQTADSSEEAEEPAKKKRRLSKWEKKRLGRAKEAGIKEGREAALAALREAGVLKDGAETPPPKQEPVDREAVKTLADFDFDQDAYFDYKVERKLAERDAKAAAELQAKQEQESQAQFRERVAEFESRRGEGAFSEIEKADIPVPPVLIEILSEDPHGLDIAYDLIQDPDEAKRIAALPKLQMLRAVAAIADEYAEPSPETPKPETPRKITKAPAPVKTLKGSGKAVVSPYDKSITAAERIAQWRAAGRV